MAAPIDIVVDPSFVIHMEEDVQMNPGALFVLLDNGEVWGRGTTPSNRWQSFGAVPNTPAGEARD